MTLFTSGEYMRERERKKRKGGNGVLGEGGANMYTASDLPNAMFYFVVSPFGHRSMTGLKLLKIFTERLLMAVEVNG